MVTTYPDSSREDHFEAVGEEGAPVQDGTEYACCWVDKENSAGDYLY